MYSGIILSSSYSSNVNVSYYSVIFICREVYYGWYLRYIHSISSTSIFIVTYYHNYRGLYILGTYFTTYIYITGHYIYILLSYIAFIGYILTWGQMSFWGSTVIMSIINCIPSLLFSLIGEHHISIPTLYRFFIIHFITPIHCISLIIIHLFHIHISTSSNPIALLSNILIELFPYCIIKDILYLYLLTYIGIYLTHIVIII